MTAENKRMAVEKRKKKKKLPPHVPSVGRRGRPSRDGEGREASFVGKQGKEEPSVRPAKRGVLVRKGKKEKTSLQEGK